MGDGSRPCSLRDAAKSMATTIDMSQEITTTIITRTIFSGRQSFLDSTGGSEGDRLVLGNSNSELSISNSAIWGISRRVRTRLPSSQEEQRAGQRTQQSGRQRQ